MVGQQIQPACAEEYSGILYDVQPVLEWKGNCRGAFSKCNNQWSITAAMLYHNKCNLPNTVTIIVVMHVKQDPQMQKKTVTINFFKLLALLT